MSAEMEANKKMKVYLRVLCGMAALLLMLMGAAMADEVKAEVTVGKNVLAMETLCDGDDATGYQFKKGRNAAVTIELAEGESLTAIAARLNVLPASVTVSVPGAKKGKLVPVMKAVQPGADFLLTLDAPVTGRVQLDIELTEAASLMVGEMHLLDGGALPETVHAFRRSEATDILYVVPTLDAADMAQLAEWTEEGRSVQAVSVSAWTGEGLNQLTDEMWASGVDRYPMFGTQKAVAADADAAHVAKNWSTESIVKALTAQLRSCRPYAVVCGGEGSVGETVLAAAREAAQNASDFNFDVDSAAAYGIWPVETVITSAQTEALAQTDWSADRDETVRDFCVQKFADAEHGDIAAIPYPAERLEDGYLPTGEFVHEDPEAGLWAYVSENVQIQIVRYTQPEVPRVWYVTDIIYKPEYEAFHHQEYINASFPGQMIYPETLAQTSRMVFGMSGDYYIYREDSHATGNIIRGGKVLYNQTKPMAFPNLDTAALRADGSMAVYASGEISADDLAAQGNVTEALSFGPYLVRNGALRIWNGKNWDHREPRNSLGMVAPGHLKVVTVEGRFSKGVGPAGMGINMLGEILYAQGVEEAINLDGGNTATLVFMGKKINRTASKSGKTESVARNMSELFGIGTSDLVRTDRLNGK